MVERGWIPAFAGMTGFAKVSWWADGAAARSHPMAACVRLLSYRVPSLDSGDGAGKW